MSKNSCSVSVIIPCYKSSAFLRRAVDSVLTQTYKPTEIIIVDDASDDSGLTFKCIKKIKKDYIDSGISIRTIFLKRNSGPSRARNRGWNISTNDYIAFLDSDDAWHPKKIELQYKFMKFNSKFDVTSHSSRTFNNSIKDKINNFNVKQVYLKKMVFKNCIQTRTVMLKRDLTLRFDDKIRYGEDYDLWMRMMNSGVIFGYSKQVLAYKYDDDFNYRGLSSNLLKMEKAELKVLHKQYLSGNLNILQCIVVSIWSILKFIRRFIKALF
jgi:glycosyltransferase involved in cell wall biosynthesis